MSRFLSCPLPFAVAIAGLSSLASSAIADGLVRWHGPDGRLRHVAGDAGIRAADPLASAQRFVAEHAESFGADAADLAPAPAAAAVAVMRDAATGGYRFTALRFGQRRGGLEVLGARLTVLVRRAEGFPVVLASGSLRDLGGYRPDDAEVDGVRLLQRLGARQPAWRALTTPRAVIWAGTAATPVAPRLAAEVVVAGGDPADPATWLRRRLVLDATDGAVLHDEDLILHDGLAGSVEGLATEGPGADVCHDAIATGLPYARVEAGGQVAHADAAGAFVVSGLESAPVLVRSSLRGPWFEVHNAAGIDSEVLQSASPPGPVVLLHNPGDGFEFVRSQVNAYVHANVVRDFVLSVHPDYPGVVDQPPMTVNVNVNDDCNAFYSTSEPSMNFFTSGAGCVNTAFDTVVYHEYGHHLVAGAGSGQGAYGEGMSDVIAMLVTDDPRMGAGWFGDCDGALRSADNGCRYDPLACSDCGSEVHACGQLLSGAFWTLRSLLQQQDPDGYRGVLAALAINSILLHEGTGVDPSIAMDLLVLDDDNGTLQDGTPHADAIVSAFAAHGLAPDGLDLLAFELPDGLPPCVQPAGGTTVRVRVIGVGAAARPDSVTLHVSQTGAPGSFVAIAATPLDAQEYEAVVPSAPCGTVVHVYFSARTEGGLLSTWPPQAPLRSVPLLAAAGVEELFVDDFEGDLGWSVTNDAALTAGAWERGTPAGDGTRGDPTGDGDGSGSCYLTGNAPGDSDVDGGATALVSPPMDVRGPGPVVVSYRRWLSNAAGAAPGQDALHVQASGDDGSWTGLETVGPTGVAATGGWCRAMVRIDGLLDAGAAARVRFVVADEAPASIVEAAIDGFLVLRGSCGCAEDVDGSGVVDVDDLTAVILAWGTGDDAADLTGDGTVDVDDLVAVVLAWGC